ncbi:MAG: 50S ribosomal protein L25/general stress protein Ctc [Alphaproteobacteria bacterium]|nr:50S ribosomal protein L25/general stress protein Ctc [Alphaproteobacteria bacterium]
MVEVVQLNAEKRDGSGRGSSRALRRKGLVPGVVYGGNKDNEFVAVDWRIIAKEYQRGGFANRVVDLSTSGSKAQRVLPRDVQLDPVSDKPVHVDFLRLIPGSTVRLEVPVAFVGESEAPGLKRGGIVNVVRHTIAVVCLAEKIPDRIFVNLAGMDIGDSLHISQVPMPDGVKPAVKRDFTVASITAPTAVREEALEAAAKAKAAAGAPDVAEGAAGADGVAAAPAADAAAVGDAKPAAGGKAAAAPGKAAPGKK